MTRVGRIAVLLTIIAGLSAGGAAGAEPGVLSKPRVIQAVRAGTAPTLDGRVDDECWKRAPEITDFLSRNTEVRATVQSYAYICYDQSNLYIAMKCPIRKGTQPFGGPGVHDSAIWYESDHVEIMLDPDRSTDADQSDLNYYQLGINAYEATFDCTRSLGGSGEDDAWNGEWVGKTHIGDDYWSVEMAIPYYALGITSQTGSTWGINLCRVKRPDEQLSSIAVRGMFVDVKKFAVLEGLNVDFEKYFFQIEPSFVAFDPTPEKPWPVLNMRVTNMSGKTRKARIDVHRPTPDGKETVESDVYTLPRKQSVVLELEPLEIDPIAIIKTGLRAIRVEPKTKKVVVTDPETGTVLALAHVREESPWIYNPMTLVVDDAWPQQVSTAKSQDSLITVHTFLPKAHLEKGEIIITLTSRETGEVVMTRNFSPPAKTTEVALSDERLPWGAYDVRAAFKDGDGRKLVASRALAVMLPGGRQRIKRLNNLTSELMNIRERGLHDQPEIAFMNPRDGWCYFRLSGNTSLTLDAGEQPLAVTKAGEKPVEVMRHLAAGRHILRVDGVPEELIVRAIPEILLHEFGALNLEFGSLQGSLGMSALDFYEQYVMDNVNTFIGFPSYLKEDHNYFSMFSKWKQSGGRLLTPCLSGIVLEERVGRFTVEQAYEHISTTRGFLSPLPEGSIADEFGNSGPLCAVYAEAVRKLKASPRFKDKLFYPYANHLYSGPEGRELVQALIETGSAIAWKRYLVSQADERTARKFLNEELVEHARRYRDLSPGSLEHIAVCFGFFSAPGGHVLNLFPSVNYKVYLDMQFNLVANDPVFQGTYGLMGYHSSYSDEETLRWICQLFRHYGIEGRTEPATSDPYQLPHLVNGDFVDGVKGWSVEPAEENSIRIDRKPGLGRLQTRSVGDTGLVTVRSAKRPNTFTQAINDLQPGGLYTFRMMTCDYEDMSKREKHAVTVKLENVTLIPGKSLSIIFPDASFVFVEKHKTWLNYHWVLFRAEGNSARVTITDWASDAEPAGPIGQELIYNYVQVQPYFESEPQL